MLKLTKSNPVKDEIDRLLSEMSGLSPESKEYSERLDHIQKLTPLLPKPQSKVPSADVILGSFTNLLGISAVLHYEKLNVITSKAFGWIRRS